MVGDVYNGLREEGLGGSGLSYTALVGRRGRVVCLFVIEVRSRFNSAQTSMQHLRKELFQSTFETFMSPGEYDIAPYETVLAKQITS